MASYLGTELGRINIKRFADGEIYVQVGESIRGADVFLVQPTSPPVNDSFMELAVMIDACRRASARSITAVIPYYGYARADRKAQGRESIAAKLTANLLTEAGADRVLAIDLHSGQMVGYFDIPVDHIYGETVILDCEPHAPRRLRPTLLPQTNVPSCGMGGPHPAWGFPSIRLMRSPPRALPPPSPPNARPRLEAHLLWRPCGRLARRRRRRPRARVCQEAQ